MYLLKLAIILSLCRDPQQLFFMFLDLLLETHILLTDYSLQLPQLKTKKNTKSFRKSSVMKFEHH